MRVVFVDGQPQALDDLRPAATGDEALALLREQPADVVVAALRLPGGDGIDLLGKVRERNPETVRILLFDPSERDRALGAASVAHQFLPTPCDSAALAEGWTGPRPCPACWGGRPCAGRSARSTRSRPRRPCGWSFDGCSTTRARACTTSPG